MTLKAPKRKFVLLITGGGGCGKRHLIKTLYHSITMLLMHGGACPDKWRILVLAATGVSANIDRTSIHSG